VADLNIKLWLINDSIVEVDKASMGHVTQQFGKYLSQVNGSRNLFFLILKNPGQKY